ncbi:hypothetical protein JG687_00005034 [Phytophthora cactorum]|uniref:Nucleotide-diphospho-sugar transferase n=1 Tax=Phytophthora cactorum TaxID=29920 RepID=A0A8T1UNA7_9STRA|nr:hypothetical protein JG687_00005034 [Phytophthora cactorum]
MPGFSLPNGASNGQNPRDGIVMVVYPKLFVSAYAGIRVLRDVLKCRLPIEIWFHVDEIGQDFTLLAPLQKLAIFVGGISFHPIYNPRAMGFLSRVFAIYNSHFDRVLFLDADNVPVRDPKFLFSSMEFEANGAIFWPDFWHPRRTLFNLHAQSMVWELLDLSFVDMFEQESSQLLVDRTRHAAPLELVYFYAFHEPNYFQKLDLVYGDKDLFRLAWMKLGAPFHMIETVPAMAGRAINGSFCGRTTVQHDVDGNLLFLHRNQHKLTGERLEKSAKESAATGNMVIPPPETESGGEFSDEYPDPIIWTHLMSFSKNVSKAFYRIESHRASPEFPQRQPCYGRRDVNNLQFFELHKFSEQKFSGIEADLRHYAFEAANQLIPPVAQDRMAEHSAVCSHSRIRSVLDTSTPCVLYTLVMLLWVVSSVHDIASTSESLPLSIVHLFTNGQHTPTPEELEAEAHALTVKSLPGGATVERQFKCIGWRATTDCSANGARDVANDKPCNRHVEDGASGYCEIEDVESGRQVVEKAIAPGYNLPNVKENEEPRAGIVMVVYPTLLASADELQRVPGALEPLKGLAGMEAEGGMTFREITDRRAFRFAAKVYAVYNSAFDQVLFLDADNVPVRDPTFLFESEEFVRTGSVFWPDFWHPQFTIFHIMADSLLWQLLDMKYVNMFEQESGQLLIDRRRHTATMELVNFYTFHNPSHFDQLKLVYGDKDLFRYAWIKLNVPFYMIQTPPAVAGKVVNESFCGMTMRSTTKSKHEDRLA